MIIIRRATEEDISRILEIERETIFPSWSHGALLSEIYGDDSFFAVADEGGTIVGFAILRRISDEGELFQIAVDAAHGRRGIADTLMAAILGWARGCGIASVYLEVRKSNEAAIGLYNKHGFKQAGARKDYYTDPVEDALVFSAKTAV